MKIPAPEANHAARSSSAAWGGVVAIALGMASLSATQSLPISLLTPIARDLRINEGLAGQTVTATAAVGLLTSLVIAAATRTLNRRTLLVVLSGLQVVANLLVAVASTLPILMAGRMILGVAVGGSWALAAPLILRLVPVSRVPRAFAILFAGSALAKIAAAPLSSALEPLVGWRRIALGLAAVSLVVAVWQAATLPSLPASGTTRFATLFHLLKRASIRRGLLGIILAFSGHHTFFTYVRPFLEHMSHVGAQDFSGMLLGFGIASFVGIALAAPLVEGHLRLTLVLMPLLMSIIASGLAVGGDIPWVPGVLIALWGLTASIIPVGWSTWLTRAAPDEAESGGGLFVAVTQLATTLGAAVGGVAFVRYGTLGIVSLSGTILFLAALVTIIGLRAPTAPSLGRDPAR